MLPPQASGSEECGLQMNWTQGSHRGQGPRSCVVSSAPHCSCIGFILTSLSVASHTGLPLEGGLREGRAETPTWEGLAKLGAFPASPKWPLRKDKVLPSNLLAKPDAHEQVKVQPASRAGKRLQDTGPDPEAELSPTVTPPGIAAADLASFRGSRSPEPLPTWRHSPSWPSLQAAPSPPPCPVY